MEGKTFTVRWAATLAAIARMRGTPIPGTKHEVDEDQIDTLGSALEKFDEQH